MIRGHLYLEKRMVKIYRIPVGDDRNAAKERLRRELENELSEAKAKAVKLETDLERAVASPLHVMLTVTRLPIGQFPTS